MQSDRFLNVEYFRRHLATLTPLQLGGAYDAATGCLHVVEGIANRPNTASCDIFDWWMEEFHDLREAVYVEAMKRTEFSDEYDLDVIRKIAAIHLAGQCDPEDSMAVIAGIAEVAKRYAEFTAKQVVEQRQAAAAK